MSPKIAGQEKEKEKNSNSEEKRKETGIIKINGCTLNFFVDFFGDFFGF